MKWLHNSPIAEHRRVLRGKGQDADESKQTTSLEQKQQRVEDTQKEAPLKWTRYYEQNAHEYSQIRHTAVSMNVNQSLSCRGQVTRLPSAGR